MRSFDSASVPGEDLVPRLLRQLALDGMAAGPGMADGLIADIAVIGTEPYFEDGAGIGLLVKAQDNELLDSLVRLLR